MVGRSETVPLMLDFTARTRGRDTATASGAFALRDLLNALFYYRRAAAIVFGTIVAIGVLAAILMPPTYSAEARLLPLSAGIYNVADAGTAPQPGQVLDPAAVVNVELQLLDSLELHRTVVRHRLPPGATPAQINTALDSFEKHLHVTKATDANVIELTFVANDPAVAAGALHDLIAQYFESRANVLTSGRVAFLEDQRDKTKALLDRANAAIATFQQQNGVLDITAQVAGAVAQDDLLRRNKLDNEAALADGRKSLATLGSEAHGVPSDVVLYSDNTEAARALGEMQTQLLTLQAKRADLASRYMNTAPQVTQADRQIAALQATIRQQQNSLVTTRRTGRNQYFDSTRDRLAQARASVDGALARHGELDAQIAVSGARLQRLTGIADRLAAMKLERDVLADSFKSLSAQVEQARVQLNQTTDAGSPNVRIIEAPTPPAKRSNPPLLLIAGSIVAALLIAGATLFVLDSLREVFLAPTETERALGVPVLSAPLEESGDGDDGPSASVRREYGRMIGAIDSHGNRTHQSVLLLAPDSRMSLQKAALGLGRAIVRRGIGRVVLVRFGEDAPPPRPGEPLDIEHMGGMATAVVGISAGIGARVDSSPIAALKAEYDYVVVTAPPTALGYESIELAAAVDAVVPVIEAERTRRPVVRSLIRQLDDIGAHTLGVVLLERRSHIPAWLYRLVIERRFSRA